MVIDLKGKTAEISSRLGIDPEKLIGIESKLSAEDYYDLVTYLSDNNFDGILRIYQKYLGKEPNQDRIFDSFQKIWKSHISADSRKRKILNLLNNLGDRELLDLLKKLNSSGEAGSLFVLYNMIFGEFPKNYRDEDTVIGKIQDYISGNKNKSEDTFQNPFLKPISESNLPNKEILIKEGYNYCAVFDNKDLSENLLDWLEDNKYKFLIDDKGNFNIECIDRDTLYRIAKKITELTKKFQYGHKFMRDSKMKNTNEGKKKSVKNPAAAALSQKQFHGKTTSKTRDEIERKADKFDRKAKHKENPVRTEKITVGEKMIYRGQEVEVQIPNGPLGSVGVLLDGKLTMVESKDIIRTDESIIGLSAMPMIGRLKELAGIDEISNTTPSASSSGETSPAIPIENSESEKSNDLQQAISLIGEIENIAENIKVSEYKILVQELECALEKLFQIGNDAGIKL